jgi:predicted TPR repeat methyltransferase
VAGKHKRKRSGARHLKRGPDIRDALLLHRSGRLDQAERMYRRILAADPDNVDALHFFGVLQHQRGSDDAAVRDIERAVSLMPDYADAWNNLGNVLKEMARLDAAERAYRKVITLNPGHADALSNLGVVLRGQGKYAEAARAYETCLAIEPKHVAAWQNLGNLLARLDRLEDAANAYRRLLELRPNDPRGCDALGKTLSRLGRTDEAVAVYRHWLAADPASGVARHMLAACTGQDVPGRADDDYVRELFDGFASSFDEVLDGLGYRAPSLIAALLEREQVPLDGTQDVVDAGCGTGLCARFLRPLARRLVGIDLSSGMLARARARGEYDELVEAELVSWLARQQGSFDLIISADTLCYFGKLDAALLAAGDALRPGGHLAFTVEHSADAIGGYRLGSSGRYAHTTSYVTDRLAAAALTIESIDHVNLRREFGKEVEGLLVHARRPVTGPSGLLRSARGEPGP